MDNPQHYQPLSHALHPPLALNNQQPHYSVYDSNANGANVNQEEHEEEEEEEEDEDEGLVASQLDDEQEQDGVAGGSTHPSPTEKGPDSDATAQAAVPGPPAVAEPPKRRPGRPRGSKNRKPRASGTEPPKPLAQQQQQSAPWTTTHPEVNSQNQLYYEFQWRVLNLCAEFYGAAEDLVKQTNPLVIAQCYQMGPNAKFDPLVLLADAKRNCDTLLKNHENLVTDPPPPMYPVIPNYTTHVQHPPPPPVTAPSVPSAKNQLSAMITNAQSFFVPLTTQQPQPPPPMYPPQAHSYPTTSYYQYPYAAPYTYTAPPPQQQPVPQQPQPQQTTMQTTQIANTGGNQGAWSDEETERLKKLAEESRSVGNNPGREIEWDWVVHQWGNSRTRHQILIKATSLGLKESSSRGVKRRRETDTAEPGASSHSPAPTPTPAPVQPTVASGSSTPSATATASATASPTLQYPTINTSASASAPAPASSSKPSSKNQTQTQNQSKGKSMPWPMPTVAANTPPVLSASASPPVPQGTEAVRNANYYRAKAGGTAGTTHQFVYTHGQNGKG